MRTLGIRVEPKQVSFVVFCNKENDLLCVDEIVVPKTLEIPEQLKYIRNSILDILREYQIQNAALRVAEGVSINKSTLRCYIEAVIQEAFSSSNVEHYFVMRMNTIISRLKINKDDYNSILNSSKKLNKIDNSSFKKAMNEAMMVAVAAVNND
ncbi:hypothetical protein [Xenorhabdus thuongxuanensis]|uniref:Uncharacterized protein n=1 Tax=Xenorhabdus thuongxuanensis TaxID=1873484 RepID=A0A1Q5U3S8_9GAMM|nr:hypothetical protein [Xenorhabdus thuongxuanensis]OKP07105.1 hypothetical protein Xentx_01709 [Xenorhabdus thuongxuanensis]